MGVVLDTTLDLQSLPAHPNPPDASSGKVLFYVEGGVLYACDAPVPGPGGRSTGGVPGAVWYDTHRGPLVFMDTVATATQAPTAANIGITGFVVNDIVVRQADYEMFQYQAGQFGGSLVDTGAKWSGVAANGLPAGGATNQVLAKKSATNYDTQWIAPPANVSNVASMNTGARAWCSTAAPMTANVWTKVPLNTVNYDPGNHFQIANGRYIAPANGLYQVSGEIDIASTAANQWALATVYVNGSEYARGVDSQVTGTGEGIAPQVSALVQLNAGDYVELWCLCSSALPLFTGIGSLGNWMSVVQVDVALQPSSGQVSPGTAARAYRNAALALAANTFTKVPLDTLSADPGGHFNLTSGRYVAPVTGYYQVNGAVSANSTATNQTVEAAVYKNGAGAVYGTAAPDPTSGSTMQSLASDVVFLNAGDYLELYCFSSAALNWNVGPLYGYLSVVQVDQPIGGAGGNAVTPTTGARAYRNAAFTPPTSLAWAKLPLDTITRDDGHHFDIANSRYIAPQAGWYQVNGNVSVNAGTAQANATWYASLYVNGTTKIASNNSSRSDNFNEMIIEVADLVYLNAGDYVELWYLAQQLFPLFLGSNGNYLSVVQVDQPTPVATNTAARAYRNAAFSLTANNVSTKVPVDTVVPGNDPGGHMDVATNHRYNVTAAGWYQVNGQLAVAAPQVAYYAALIAKNGAEFSRGGQTAERGGVAGDNVLLTVSDLVYCNPGDYLELWGYTTSTAVVPLVLGASLNYLSVVKVDQPLYANNPTVVTTLPATPFDGQEVYFVADAANGVKWHLRYNAGSSSAYKWEYLGGSEMRADVTTAQAMPATQNTWEDLATVGPQITLPVGGDYEIEYGALPTAAPTTGYLWYVGVAVGAAVPTRVCASDGGASSGGASAGQNIRDSVRLTALASGAVLKLQYQWVGVNPTWQNRYLKLKPVRVG